MILGFYGDGKGKTSAALGTMMRALGAKQAVRAVFFMKNWVTSETLFLDRLKQQGLPVDYYLAGDDEFVHGSQKISKEDAQKRLKFGKIEDKDSEDIELAAFGLDIARKYIEENPFLLILDEIGVAVSFGLLKEQEALDVINLAKEQKIHVIITGKELSKKLQEICDGLTDVKKVRHPFDDGIHAVKGIDY